MKDFDSAVSEKVYKIDKKVDDFRKRIKDSEDLKLKDEVFDTSTLMSLYKLSSRGYLDALGGTISTGKEANIFHAIRMQDNKEQELAIKIYRINNSNFKAMQDYLIGDVRFRNIRHTKKDIVLAWTRKEFRNLTRALECGLNVPKPIITERNILIMEFKGTDNIPYPQLREFHLTKEQATRICSEVSDFMRRLFCDAQLVHSDLSEYNILLEPESLTPVFIDMGQSVTLDHLNARDFLLRDITNMAHFFARYGIEMDVESTLEMIVKSRIDHQ
ncbi:MAG: serine protein kinase RIO [Methanosarcinales archaeon]|nr:serine protein kinase RIO [ANME-2 cluster archaeon]MDW7774716.1 serine protein kinase RIO [Methanosarcinales archaeon]